MVFCAALELWRASGVPPAETQFFADSIRSLSALAVGFIELTSRAYYVAALRIRKRGAGQNFLPFL